MVISLITRFWAVVGVKGKLASSWSVSWPVPAITRPGRAVLVCWRISPRAAGLQTAHQMPAAPGQGLRDKSVTACGQPATRLLNSGQRRAALTSSSIQSSRLVTVFRPAFIALLTVQQTCGQRITGSTWGRVSAFSIGRITRMRHLQTALKPFNRPLIRRRSPTGRVVFR